jgi:hypothetical protein
VPVELFFGAICTLALQETFGFGASEADAVDFGLFRGLLAIKPFSMSLQIDDVAHAFPNHADRRFCRRSTDQ